MRPVNLIPPEERRGASRAPAGSTGNGVYVFLGALVVALLAVSLVVLTGNKIHRQETQLAKLKAEKKTVSAEAKETDVAPDAAFELAAKAHYDAIYKKARDRFNFELRLRQLTRAIPNSIKLTKLTGSVAADAGADAAAASSGPGDPNMVLELCVVNGDPWQQFADVITRMRNLDGVDKVTVTKANKGEQGGSTAPAPTGAAPSDGTSATGEASGPCVPGTDPTTSLKVSFKPKGGDGDAAAAASGAAPQTATQQAQSAASTSNAANSAAGADSSSSGGGGSP